MCKRRKNEKCKNLRDVLDSSPDCAGEPGTEGLPNEFLVDEGTDKELSECGSIMRHVMYNVLFL